MLTYTRVHQNSYEDHILGCVLKKFLDEYLSFLFCFVLFLFFIIQQLGLGKDFRIFNFSDNSIFSLNLELSTKSKGHPQLFFQFNSNRTKEE